MRLHDVLTAFLFLIGSLRYCSFGDSGGPLISYEKGVPVVVGISSTTVGCVATEFPAFHARVSPMVSFLRAAGASFKTNRS